MPEEYRHPHGRRIHAEGRIGQYLAALPQHFHLLAGVAVLQEFIDLRHAVEGDLLRYHLRSHRCLAAKQRRRLHRELLHGPAARTGDGLIGRDVDAFDAGDVVQGLHRHHHLNG